MPPHVCFHHFMLSNRFDFCGSYGRTYPSGLPFRLSVYILRVGLRCPSYITLSMICEKQIPVDEPLCVRNAGVSIRVCWFIVSRGSFHFPDTAIIQCHHNVQCCEAMWGLLLYEDRDGALEQNAVCGPCMSGSTRRCQPSSLTSLPVLSIGHAFLNVVIFNCGPVSGCPKPFAQFHLHHRKKKKGSCTEEVTFACSTPGPLTSQYGRHFWGKNSSL